jgi:hypothetical protein
MIHSLTKLLNNIHFKNKKLNYILLDRLNKVKKSPIKKFNQL